MPKASDDETASARSRSKKIIFGLLVVSFIVLSTTAAAAVLVVHSDTQPCAISIPHQETGRAAFTDSYKPKDCVSLWRADTQELRTKGLSERKNMAHTQGMLFIFDRPGRQCMWMKDMYISLDMVWLNSNKVVTEIKRDIKPETYPKVFCGMNSDIYVIELLNGTVDRVNLKVGDQLAI